MTVKLWKGIAWSEGKEYRIQIISLEEIEKQSLYLPSKSLLDTSYDPRTGVATMVRTWPSDTTMTSHCYFITNLKLQPSIGQVTIWSP
jgi:hypothetical protein